MCKRSLLKYKDPEVGGLVPSELTRQAGYELLRGWERRRRRGRRHRERSELEKEDQEGNGKVGGD